MLQHLTVSVDKVVVRNLDVGIKDCCHVAARLLDFFVHLGEFGFSEVLWVELEVFVAIFSAVLISPLNVHDEQVDREFEIRKVLISLHDSVSADPIILGKVEAEDLCRRKGDETSNCRKVVRHFLIPVHSCTSSFIDA